MPNVYGPAMIAFTKLIKPPFSFLLSEGYLSVIYVEIAMYKVIRSKIS